MRTVIPKTSIARLSIYKRCLLEFKENGIENISSRVLGERLGIKPEQIRKDLAYFGAFGKKRVGYAINDLIESLTKILGTREIQKVILIGAGNLGSALLSYRSFLNGEAKIIAAFDIDTQKEIYKRLTVPVHHINKMAEFVKINGVKVAILTVPVSVAQGIADILMQAGIKGILNFAPLKLNVPDDVVVNDVDLATELEKLIYFVSSTSKA